jgi:hypothetical protein
MYSRQSLSFAFSSNPFSSLAWVLHAPPPLLRWFCLSNNWQRVEIMIFSLWSASFSQALCIAHFLSFSPETVYSPRYILKRNQIWVFPFKRSLKQVQLFFCHL